MKKTGRLQFEATKESAHREIHPGGAPILTVNRLSVSRRYKSGELRPIVSNISLEIQTRNIVTLLGESGAGKTTVAHAITGCLPENFMAVKGDIYYKNTLCPAYQRNNGLGKEMVFLPQDASAGLNPDLPIKKHIPDRFKHSLDLLALLMEKLLLPSPLKILNSYPGQISGGEKKRCVLALGLLLNPPLLILDEPTENLDEKTGRATEEILHLYREGGNSLLLITHNLKLTRRLSDFIYIMDKGRIVESGTPEKIFTDPRQPFTREIIQNHSIFFPNE